MPTDQRKIPCQASLVIIGRSETGDYESELRASLLSLFDATPRTGKFCPSPRD